METWHKGGWLKKLLAHTPAGALVLAAAGGAVALTGTGPSIQVHARGFVDAQERPVAATELGRVEKVWVLPGQRVHAGDILATLHTESIVARRTQALAELKVAQARVGAETDLQATALQHADTVALQVQAEDAQSRAQLGVASHLLSQLEAAAAEKLIPALDVEPVRQQREGLAARVAVMERGAPLEFHDGRASRVDKRVAPSREAVKAAQALVASLDVALEQTRLRAPADGVVSQVVHQPGEVVAAGSAVLVMLSARPGVVTAWLPERSALQVDAGAAVSVRALRAGSELVAGQVAVLAPLVEEFPVRARLNAQLPMWGRWVQLKVPAHADLLPGEAVHVVF